MLKHLVKTWWDRITAAFFHFTRRESFLRLHVPGRTSSSKREQFFWKMRGILMGAFGIFERHHTCWKQNIWRFGRNKGFTPPQTSSKRSDRKMCLKDWGKRVCWTHCMAFDSNLPKTGHTLEFCCLFQSWCLRCATVHERIISHAVIVHILSERIIRNHHWMIWTIFQCSKFLNFSSLFGMYTPHIVSTCFPIVLFKISPHLFGVSVVYLTKTRTIFETWNLKNGSTLGVASNILDSMIPQIPRLSNIGLILIGKRSPYVFSRRFFWTVTELGSSRGFCTLMPMTNSSHQTWFSRLLF